LPKLILDFYHRICPQFSKVEALTKSRIQKIKLRFNEMQKAGFEPYKTFETVFEKLGASDFCNGINNRGWKADFDFIVQNDKKWLQIYEGKYNNRQAYEKPSTVDRNMQSIRMANEYFENKYKNE
jgi:hypothetical protein